MKNGFKTYLVTYRHEGAEWHLEIPATGYDDARQRLGQLALARIDGESVAKIPGPLGPLAALAVFARNALTGHAS